MRGRDHNPHLIVESEAIPLWEAYKLEVNSVSLAIINYLQHFSISIGDLKRLIVAIVK